MTAYENNEVEITIDRANESEARVNCNGQNLIWISRDQQEEFIHELTELLNRYRI